VLEHSLGVVCLGQYRMRLRFWEQICTSRREKEKCVKCYPGRLPRGYILLKFIIAPRDRRIIDVATSMKMNFATCNCTSNEHSSTLRQNLHASNPDPRPDPLDPAGQQPLQPQDPHARALCTARTALLSTYISCTSTTTHQQHSKHQLRTRSMSLAHSHVHFTDHRVWQRTTRMAIYLSQQPRHSIHRSMWLWRRAATEPRQTLPDLERLSPDQPAANRRMELRGGIDV
jgi:hypothetical protein